jgi:hypothetical protein
MPRHGTWGRGEGSWKETSTGQVADPDDMLLKVLTDNIKPNYIVNGVFFQYLVVDGKYANLDSELPRVERHTFEGF